MGFFSYKCAKSDISIPAYPDANLPIEASKVVLITPKNRKIFGVYDGYGNIDGNDLYAEIALDLYGKKDRDLIFNDTQFIFFDDKIIAEIKKFNFDDKIVASDFVGVKDSEIQNVIIGNTMNDLIESGLKVRDIYDSVNDRMVKIVRQDHYKNENFKDLKPSKSDETQGYFYEPSDIKKIMSSLITKKKEKKPKNIK